MEEVNEHGSLVFGDIGRQVTDGLEVLYLNGSEDATITSVESVGGEEALKFLGARVAGPDRALGSYQQLEGFPPAKPGLRGTVEAVGAVIRPREKTSGGIGYELLLGYEIVADDTIAARDAVRVTYRVGDEEFEWISPAALVYCPEGMNEVCLEQES